MENESLVADLIQFVANKPRTYEEVMDAWRTSCPRLTIWEDAVDYGFVELRERTVSVTEEGTRFLEQYR